jgi:FG-GAP-like repeat/FG-GAP repeat
VFVKADRLARAHCGIYLVLAMFSLGRQHAEAGQFKHVVYYPAGQAPYQVVTAQFARAGNLDLAVADYLTNQVSILLGNGDGTFQKAIKFGVPAPIALAVGDLNGDGNPDLVVVESGGTGNGVLAIFLGEGNGHFRLKASYQLGSEAGFITVADFDGDGKPDVAETDAGNGSEGVLRVFRGTGKGTLLKPTVYKIPNTPGDLAAGDLNGDHSPDLAVTQFSTGSVAVLLNDGTGHFLKPVTYSAGGGEVVDVKIADLRNDGRQDLVIANGSLSAVAVLLNKGDGTFGPVKLYPTHCDVEAVVVADFNLDGHLDAAVAAHIDNSALIYGKGDGTFGPPVVIKDEIGTAGGYSIAFGDFNNDGAPDLAIPIEEYGKVAIMLNTQ